MHTSKVSVVQKHNDDDLGTRRSRNYVKYTYVAWEENCCFVCGFLVCCLCAVRGKHGFLTFIRCVSKTKKKGKGRTGEEETKNLSDLSEPSKRLVRSCFSFMFNSRSCQRRKVSFLTVKIQCRRLPKNQSWSQEVDKHKLLVSDSLDECFICVTRLVLPFISSSRQMF